MPFRRLSAGSVAAGLVVGAFTLAGCSTHVQPTTYVPSAAAAAQPLPRPDVVMVYDFALDPSQIQVDSGIGGQARRAFNGRSAADAQLRDADAVQSALTDTLVDQIQKMGLRAELATPQAPPGNVLVIRGRVDEVSEGNRTRRTVIGFGAGQSSVRASAEVLYAPAGMPPRLLQTYDANANSGRTPGLGVGAASAAAGAAAGAAANAGMHVANLGNDDVGQEATRLATRMAYNLGQFFVQQGWITPAAAPAYSLR